MLNGTNGQQFTPAEAVSADPGRPISLVFLANRAFYQSPINDTWFNAVSPVSRTATINGAEVNETFYLNDKPGSVLGCMEQAQIW
jgi:hypothetical protein